MTKTPVAERAPAEVKSNREAFLDASRSIVADGIRHGTNIAKIRALRNYMFERLDGVAKEDTDAVKASIIGEMFSTHDASANFIMAYAREKMKFDGPCGPAMAAIAAEQGIYTPTAEIWGGLAKALTTAKKNQKDYVDLWRALRAELRAIADKANQQMNNVLEELGTKEKKKGKGFGKKKDKEVATVASVSPVEMTPDTMVKAVCELDIPAQIEALRLLVESMLVSGVDEDAIAECVQSTLREAHVVETVPA